MRKLLFLIPFLPFLASAQDQHKVIIDQGLPTLSFEVEIVPDDLDPLIDLFLVKDGTPSPVKVSGKYWSEGNRVFFSPYNRLQGGFKFEAVFHYPNKPVHMQFEIPTDVLPEVPLAEVVDIYPIDGIVPANVLYFQVRFSQPMSQDAAAYKHVHIGDADSLQELTWRNKAFWLDSGRVLILMIHPGRVKTGIDYMSQLGSLFTEGESSEIHVAETIKDALGRPIVAPYSKKFKVTAIDREIPKILYEQIKVPSSKSGINHLEVQFSEQMNYVSILDGLTVLNQDGKLVDIRIKSISGTEYHITHAKGEWPVGNYTLVFSKVVADLANNRLNRPFEVKDVNEKLKDVPVEMPFIVKD